jgi:hypothetical protein
VNWTSEFPKKSSRERKIDEEKELNTEREERALQDGESNDREI